MKKVLKAILKQLHYRNQVAYYEAMKNEESRTGNPTPPPPPPPPPGDDD